MKFLGVDYGLKRIGLALSDSEGRMAFPYRVIKNSGAKRVIQALPEILKQEQVSEIVLGLPSEVSGMDDSLRRKVQEFTSLLAGEISLPIHTENEMFSSRVASEHDPKELDASAAAVVLQSFLDKRNKVS